MMSERTLLKEDRKRNRWRFKNTPKSIRGTTGVDSAEVEKNNSPAIIWLTSSEKNSLRYWLSCDNWQAYTLQKLKVFYACQSHMKCTRWPTKIPMNAILFKIITEYSTHFKNSIVYASIRCLRDCLERKVWMSQYSFPCNCRQRHF